MSRVCDICGKSKKSGNTVTFSHRGIKRTWSPNLRRVKVYVDGTPMRKNVCTRCLRSGKVQRTAPNAAFQQEEVQEEVVAEETVTDEVVESTPATEAEETAEVNE